VSGAKVEVKYVQKVKAAPFLTWVVCWYHSLTGTPADAAAQPAPASKCVLGQLAINLLWSTSAISNSAALLVD